MQSKEKMEGGAGRDTLDTLYTCMKFSENNSTHTEWVLRKVQY